MNLPKLLLFDTGCIFEVVKLGLWEQLCKRFRVVVPSTVVRDEVLFVNLRPGNITPIDLSHDVAAGRIEEYAASASELKQVLKCGRKLFLTAPTQARSKRSPTCGRAARTTPLS